MTVDIEKLEALGNALILANENLHENPHDDEVGDRWSLANDRFTEAASPECVLALIAESKRRSTQVRLAGISAEVTAHQEVGRAITETLAVTVERDQLRAEVAGLKTGYEAYERVNAELTQRIANLELCQTASLGVSGIIKSAASDLGFDAAGEDSALDHLIGLARAAAALRAECEESTAVVDQLAKILAGVAIALKGEEPSLHRHGYHDVVELVTVLKFENDLRKAECEALRNNQSFSDAFYEVSCLLGVTGARPEAPLVVFRQEVVPALQAVISNSKRYEWLRDPDNQEEFEPDSDCVMPPIICGYAEHEDILAMESLDKAIDNAMDSETSQ